MIEDMKIDSKFKKNNTYGKGRPSGSKNKATNVISIIGQEMNNAIIMSIAQQALAGDLTAARLILDCTHGRAKTKSFINLDYDFETNTLDEIKNLMGSLIKDMGRGEISIEDLTDISKVLENKAGLNLAEQAEEIGYLKDELEIMQRKHKS